MTMNDIYRLKVLAGIHMDKEGNTIKQEDGSNISITGSKKGKIQRERNIQPGTDEWFRLWFSKPYLTGEKPTGK